MECKRIVEERHSTRKFKSREIPEETVQEIFKAINSAPSAGNIQAFKVFAAKKPELKKQIASACFGQSFIAQAPVVLVFCANLKESARLYKERGKNLYAIQDASIAAVFAWLSAVNEGLSSVWVGAFNDEELQNAIGSELQPVAVLPLGFADEKPRKASRKSLKEVIKEI